MSYTPRSEYGKCFLEPELSINSTFNDLKIKSIYFRNKSELDGEYVDIFDDEISTAQRDLRKQKVILIDLENGQRFRWNSEDCGIVLNTIKLTKSYISKMKQSSRLNPKVWTEWHPIAGSSADIEREVLSCEF